MAHHVAERMLFDVAQASGRLIEKQQCGIGAQCTLDVHRPRLAQCQVGRPVHASDAPCRCVRAESPPCGRAGAPRPGQGLARCSGCRRGCANSRPSRRSRHLAYMPIARPVDAVAKALCEGDPVVLGRTVAKGHLSSPRMGYMNPEKTNNERLRELVEASGLTRPVALTVSIATSARQPIRNLRGRRFLFGRIARNSAASAMYFWNTLKRSLRSSQKALTNRHRSERGVRPALLRVLLDPTLNRHHAADFNGQIVTFAADCVGPIAVHEA